MTFYHIFLLAKFAKKPPKYQKDLNIMENLIFKAIVGSQSYGTSTPTSDIDYKGVYMQNINELIGFGYKPQIEVTKDEVYYELRRFMELLTSANPTVLELLYSPKDCVIQKSKQFDLLVQHRDKFLTKKCLNSFGGYAIAQIKKAKGLDKKMNWEKQRVERKTPLDFIYANVDGKTIPVTALLEQMDFKQENCGLVNINHFRDCYGLYHSPNNIDNLKGIILDDSNSVRLSSIPKHLKQEVIVYYNKDGYSVHCKDYREYQEWLETRNTQRYVDIQGHDQKIDGKNLMHCRRLIDTAMEIPMLKTINVKRPNADYLLSIRRGEVDLESIIQKAEEDILLLNELYENSDLPDSVDPDFVNDLLVEIRLMK
jgi:uncharacterized protein